MVIGTFPMTIETTEIFKDNKVVILALAPQRGTLAIRDAVIYSFTKYGFADRKVEIIHSERVKKDFTRYHPLKIY